MVAFGLVLAVGLGFASAPAHAQQGCNDPYGCPPPPPQPSPAVACTLNVHTASAGSTVVATVTNAPVGSLLQIILNGVTVAQAQAVQGGTILSFTVPAGSSGTFDVRVIGPGIDAVCDPAFQTAIGGARVLGEAIEDQSGRGFARTDGGTGFARTGLDVILLLLLAFLLILTGIQFNRAARRRRQREMSIPAPR